MPRPGGYWLAPSSIARLAASRTCLGAVLVGEALAEIDRARARGEGRHLGEDRGAQLPVVASSIAPRAARAQAPETVMRVTVPGGGGGARSGAAPQGFARIRAVSLLGFARSL